MMNDRIKDHLIFYFNNIIIQQFLREIRYLKTSLSNNIRRDMIFSADNLYNVFLLELIYHDNMSLFLFNIRKKTNH